MYCSYSKIKLILIAAILALIFISTHVAAVGDSVGDIAPRGAPDGRVDLGDYLLLKKYVDGDDTPSANELSEIDLAPKANPDGVLNLADMIILRQLVLSYELAASQVIGNWLGVCKEIYPDEYQQEELQVTHESFSQSFHNSAVSDCDTPWLSVTKRYTYIVNNSENIGLTGAKLDLNLSDVFVFTNLVNVSDALNTSCNRSDIAPNVEVTSSATTCLGGVQYPVSDVNHYELIKEVDGILNLGSKSDVVDEVDRASSISQDRVFTKVTN